MIDVIQEPVEVYAIKNNADGSVIWLGELDYHSANIINDAFKGEGLNTSIMLFRKIN